MSDKASESGLACSGGLGGGGGVIEAGCYQLPAHVADCTPQTLDQCGFSL